MSRRDMYSVLRFEDLNRSGLGKPSVVKKLRIGEVLSPDKTEIQTGVEGVVAYEIPYFGPDGKSLKYSRWKLIPIEEDVGIKYYQDEKTIPRLYLPQLDDWRKICADRDQRIIITEGEKKAACATYAGMPCLSVGGVWSWKAKKWSLESIPDFDWFDWRDREVEICYDGDMYSNEQVGRALVALTNMLVKRGARVYVRYLPNVEGLSKLDDYLVSRGPDEYFDLDLSEADSSRELNRFNEDLAYVKKIKAYYSTAERVMYGSPKALEQRYGSVSLPSESGKRISAISEWVRWPHMRMFEDLTYEPGQPSVLNGSFNDWRGWGAEPKRQDISQFLELIRSVENSDWFLQWLAYPLQKPGTKLGTAVVLWSFQQGTGKSFIGNVMQDIYGENATTITSAELHDDSYVWLRNKQFILGEEVSQTRSRAELGILKHVITGAHMRVNEKYVPTYVLPNRANIMFTSNQPDAIHLERGDRRFFVGRLDDTRDDKFWNALGEWRRRGGPAGFMHYLLNNVDVSDFNPDGRAPMTEEKEFMTHASMSALEQWVADLMENTDQILEDALGETAKTLRGRDVFAIENLVTMLPDEIARVSNRVGLGRALSKLGAIRRKPTRVGDKTIRLYAIRNLDKWTEWRHDPSKWADNYEGKMPMVGKMAPRKRGSGKKSGKITRLSKKRRKKR